jgi:hypothetical protein
MVLDFSGFYPWRGDVARKGITGLVGASSSLSVGNKGYVCQKLGPVWIFAASDGAARRVARVHRNGERLSNSGAYLPQQINNGFE